MRFQARLAGLAGLVSLVTELGGDADGLLSEVGIDRALFEHPEAVIPPRAFQAALGLAARATGRDDFGLMLAKRRTLEMLGALGPLVGSAPRVGDALEQLFRLLPYGFSGGVRAYVERRGPDAMLVGQVVLPDPPALDQQIDHLAGAAVGILRCLTYQDWRPEAVYLTRRKPASTATYEAFFAAPVLFGQEISGIAIRSNLLDTPIAKANFDLNRVLYAHLTEQARSSGQGFAEMVRDRVWRGLSVGQHAALGIAADLGVSLRTFQRRLDREGVSFSDLLDQARFELARRLMIHSEASLTDIAAALGFAEPAVFSRFFRRQAGRTPSDWRAEQVRERRREYAGPPVSRPA